MLVHDDFVTVARKRQLNWFQEQMNKKYESKHIRLGGTKGAVKSVKILNRIITWEVDSISVEADLRHVKTAILVL